MRGFLMLLGLQARRDRWLLAVWILGISALGPAAASAVASEFSEEAERASIVAVAAANPAFLFLRGLPDGLDVGAVVFFQAFSFTALLAGLMSTFLVVRHSRADEELGRAELVGAASVGRAAPLAATIVLGVLANAVLGAGVTAGYVIGGQPWVGSGVVGAAVASVGLVFVGVAAVVAQLAPSGRAANGLAAALVGGAYLLRGIGDALGAPNPQLTTVTPSWLSWLSPIGWGQATRPFSEPTLVPLLLAAAVFVALSALAIAIRLGRDLGSSLLPEREGRGTGSRASRSALGLAWRLQRSTLAGWAAGGIALGAIAGGLAPVVAEAVEGNSSLSDLIGSLVPGSSPDVVDVFTAAILGMAGVLASAAGVQAVLRLRAEEAEGRAELLLSTPMARARWVAATLVVAVGSVLVVALLAGAATGGAIAIITGDADALPRFIGAGLAHVPAALVFVSIAALVFAVAPRLTVVVGWSALVVGLVLGQFGELLRLPQWLQDISPYRHASAVPVEAFEPLPATVMVAIAALVAVGGSLLSGRRDLVT